MKPFLSHYNTHTCEPVLIELRHIPALLFQNFMQQSDTGKLAWDGHKMRSLASECDLFQANELTLVMCPLFNVLSWKTKKILYKQNLQTPFQIRQQQTSLKNKRLLSQKVVVNSHNIGHNPQKPNKPYVMKRNIKRNLLL